MENNNYNNPFSVENAEEQVHVEAPEVEAPVEHVEEPVIEAPVVEAVVEAPAAEEPVQALGFTETGAIGSMAADGPKVDAVSSTDLGNKVALFSTSNVRWPEVGVVYKGYNVVSKSDADKWLTRDHIRTATQEEVEQAFGNL